MSQEEFYERWKREHKPVVRDAVEGERRKEAGHERAQASRAFTERVEAARRVARTLAVFTTDDVWAAIGSVPAGHDAPSAMGSVMRFLSQQGEIERTGEKRKSERPEQHRKELEVWRRVRAGVTQAVLL